MYGGPGQTEQHIHILKTTNIEHKQRHMVEIEWTRYGIIFSIALNKQRCHPGLRNKKVIGPNFWSPVFSHLVHVKN